MRVLGVLIVGAMVAWAGPIEDSLATGRKALGNDGVATAWKLAQKALADAPDSAAAHEFAGEVLFRRGEFALADAEFKNAIELDRRLARAWWGLARVAECAAMNRTAIEDYKRAYELDPKDAGIQAAWVPRLRAAKAPDGRKVMALASPYHLYQLSLLAFENSATHIRTYGLEAMVNGSPVKLVLDTGAAGIVMSRAAAERAGLTRVSDAAVRGIGDDEKTGGYRALAEHFRIGDVEYRNAVIGVSEQNMAGIEDGLIGSNVFSEFLITLDFAGGKLRLDPLPGYQPGDELRDRAEIPEMRDAARVFRFGHVLLVPAKVTSHAGLFVLDTGAARTMMSYDLAAEAGKVDRDDRTAIRGLSGKVGDVYQSGNVVLEFAGFTQRNLGMTAIDTWQISHRLGTEISGFLGLPVLDLFTVTIDYRDGLVKFDRRP